MVKKKIRKNYTDYLVKINCIIAVLSLQDMEDKYCTHDKKKRLTVVVIEVDINIYIFFGLMCEHLLLFF